MSKNLSKCVNWVDTDSTSWYDNSAEQRQPSEVQISLQYNVNKAVDQRGGTKHTGTILIGRSSLSVIPIWKIFGYKAVHMDKKYPHTRKKYVHVICTSTDQNNNSVQMQDSALNVDVNYR